MKLFDLTPQEKRKLMIFLTWHVGYVAYVCLFAFFIYYYKYFKAYWFLKEFWILNLLAPLHTIVFILIGPYRRDWILAIRNLYRALEGDPVFCVMGYMVFGLGFYIYNGVIWGLGSLIPSVVFA